MEVKLAALMSAVGRAVQDAQNCLERQAVESYCAYYRVLPPNGEPGAAKDPEDAGGLSPLCRRFSLPDGAAGKQRIDVPEAALARHESMILDTVQVSLNIRASVQETDSAVLVEVGPGGELGEHTSFSRLELTFRSTPASEGVERVNQNTLKLL